MISKRYTNIFLFNLIILNFCAYAEVEYTDYAIPELVTSPRSLAMGNANFGEDFGPHTIFLNPASKLPVRRYKLGLITMNGELNSDTLDKTFGEKGLSFKSFEQGIDFLSQSNMRNALLKEDGGILFQRFGVTSYVQLKRLMIGYFSSHFSNGALKSINDTFYGNRREDFGPFINYTALISRKLLLGLTYAYLHRSETLGEIQSDGTSNVQRRDGITNHLTIGLKYQISRTFIFSLVSRDALSGTYFATDNDGGPMNDPNTIDVAGTLFASRNKLKINLALRDITGKYEADTSRKVQLGVEIASNRNSGYQLGFLDGGFTAGYYYKTKKYGTFSFATYDVNSEVTEVVDRDRRLVIEYTL
jgi:hypothetical protein